MKSPMNRRTFLRGSGALIGLPFLEAMVPLRAHAQVAPPRRAVMMMFPNGVYNNAWSPSQLGSSFDLPGNLSVLAPHKSRLIFAKNLSQYYGGIDGPGDHARSAGAFLTCARVMPKSASSKAIVAQSADQKMAAAIGQSVLNLGDSVPTYADGGNYYTAYGDNISWRDAETPETKVTDPSKLFTSLFGNQLSSGAVEAEYRRQTRRSVLDGVIGQVSSLSLELGASDRQKMDQYLTAIREVEKKVTAGAVPLPAGQCPQNIPAPGTNLSFNDRMEAMMRLAALAMVCDKSRVITYLLAGEGSGQSFPGKDLNGNNISLGHHNVSHHADNPTLYVPNYLGISAWYANKLKFFLDELTRYKDGNGQDLLSSTMLVYGAGFHDGNSHADRNLPLVIAGEAGGLWKTGRVIDTGGKPVANLWLTMMQAMGSKATSHGDSNGTLNFG